MGFFYGFLGIYIVLDIDVALIKELVTFPAI
jgi:hypothetical protein